MTTIILVDGIDGRTNLKAIEYLRGALPSDTVFLEEPHPIFAEMLKKARESGNGPTGLDEFILMWSSRFCLWNESVYPAAHRGSTIVIDRSYVSTIVIDRSYVSTYAFQVNGEEDTRFEKSFFFLRDTLLAPVSYPGIKIIHLHLRVSFAVVASHLGIIAGTPQEKSLMRARSGFDLFFGNPGNFKPNEIHFTIKEEGDIGQQINDALGLKKVPAPQ